MRDFVWQLQHNPIVQLALAVGILYGYSGAAIAVRWIRFKWQTRKERQ